jgi:hypothetical protein
MWTSRTAIRSARAVRLNGRQALRRNARFASDNAGSSSSSAASGLSPLTAGALSGAAAGITVFFIAYQTTGIGQVTKTAKQTKQYIDSATNSLKVQFKENTPDTNEVINTLKEAANKYARWLPGGREYVDKVFQDVETVRQRHGGEVDNIVREAYGELRDTSKKGLNLETLAQTWEVLSKHLQRLGSLAVDAGQDILNNHPQLQESFGSSFQQLQELGDQLGPEAKKQVDETWKQVRQIVDQGISFESAQKVQQLVEEKTKQVRELGSKAWEKGYEQIKPMLDQNPQVNQLVEQNRDILKSGNVSDVLSKIQFAVTSGSTLDLEKYIVK